MAPLQSFGAAAASWQNFYILTGTAAATLIGLMFVAVTFGSTIMTQTSSTDSARAWIDPTFTHFVQVLVTACLVLVPSMSGKVMGVLLVAMCLLRVVALVRVHREMKRAQSIHHDVELSDWMMGIVVPLLVYLLVGATGAGFLVGRAEVFDALAVATGAVLLNGVYGAWELMVWLAVTRSRAQ